MPVIKREGIMYLNDKKITTRLTESVGDHFGENLMLVLSKSLRVVKPDVLFKMSG